MLKVGLYIDLMNMFMNGGLKARFQVVMAFASRSGVFPLRANVYAAHDHERAQSDEEYRVRQKNFFLALRNMGFKVIEKRVKRYRDEAGETVVKANADLDLAVDALIQCRNLDRVVLVTGDGDFVQVIRAIQNCGCRVEVIGFDNVSVELRKEADFYISGFLIPNLLPFSGANVAKWGSLGSQVRGICVSHEEEKGYGFLRYLKSLDGDIWRTDSREPGSPYDTIFFHVSNIVEGAALLASGTMNLIFEFEIGEGIDNNRFQARNIRLFRAVT